MTAAILTKIVTDILKAQPAVHAALLSDDPAQRKMANEFLQHCIDIHLANMRLSATSN